MITDFLKELDFAVTVCDRQGTVIYYNDRAHEVFARYGELVGNNLKDCHAGASWCKIVEMLETGTSNSYTIEKNGVRKLIHQSPWRENGEVKGMVEISIVLPATMPHHVRS